MEMLRYEIKKITSRLSFKIAVLVLLAFILAASWNAIQTVIYVDENGEEHTGISAARNLEETKNEWKGYLTEDVLAEAIRENAKINSSSQFNSSDVQEQNKAYAKRQGIEDIRDMFNLSFKAFDGEYDYYLVDGLGTDAAAQMYEKRTENLKSWLYSGKKEAAGFTEDEKAFLINQYQKRQTPVYYEAADGWDAMLTYLMMVAFITVLVCGFITAGIFSGEFQLKADSVYFSSKLGRKSGILSKIGAGFIVITAVYWITVLLYTAIMLTAMGASGAGCYIQNGLSYFDSFYNLTYFQAWVMCVVCGYIGTVVILMTGMLVSALTRSTVIAVTVPFILTILPMIASRVDIPVKALKLLPDQLLQVSDVIKDLIVYDLGGVVTGSVPILIIVYTAISLAFVPILYLTYRKAVYRA